MHKVCLAFQALLLSSWTLNESLLVAQTSSTSAFGYQGGGVDQKVDRGMREDEQFSATKLENSSKEIVGHRDKENRAIMIPLDLNSFKNSLEAPSKIDNSLDHNLSRKKRAKNNRVLHRCEMFNPGTTRTFKSSETTLHVQANKVFRLYIDVVNESFGKKLNRSSVSINISRDVEWNTFAIEINLVWYQWKLEVVHGYQVIHTSWPFDSSSKFNFMVITVTDCIKWYSGVRRFSCQSPTTVTTSSRPTTPATVSSGTGERPSTSVAQTSNPSSAEKRGRDRVDPLYWLLLLPLVAVVAAASALGWLLMRKHYERKALAIEAADQPRVRHGNIGPIHDSNNVRLNPVWDTNDVWLNPGCGTGTWRPSSDVSSSLSHPLLGRSIYI